MAFTDGGNKKKKVETTATSAPASTETAVPCEKHKEAAEAACAEHQKAATEACAEHKEAAASETKACCKEAGKTAETACPHTDKCKHHTETAETK